MNLNLISGFYFFLISLMISLLAEAEPLSSSLNSVSNNLPLNKKNSISVEMLKTTAFNHKSLAQLPISNIVLVGSARQKRKLTRWLNDIALTSKGFSTLKSIEASGHILTIKHSVAARLSSGRTIAPMTQKITNGTGDNVLIIFDADMDDRGSHRVFGMRNELIEFNALQNLYHELAHAIHQMQGTWRYFASEKQAIEEENEFRKDLAEINGEQVRLRYRTKGVLITSVASGGLGYQLSQ